MFKHAVEAHGGREDLKFYIVREKIDKDPMRRILRESIRIREKEMMENVQLMNTEEEFHSLKTIRTEFSRNWWS